MAGRQRHTPRVFRFDTPEVRRAWSFAAILGGCVIFTIFAAVGVYIVSGNAKYSFWLALAAHAQVLVGMTGFAFLLGRRVHLEVGENGVTISDASQAATDKVVEDLECSD